MNIFFLCLGIVFVIWSIIEALWTTIWIVGDSAPLTSRFTTSSWNLLRSIISDKNHRALSLAGPFILILGIVLWISFLSFGWMLIFYSDPSSISSTRNNAPPDFSDIFWYVGYCISTIGNGDFSPNGGLWQVLSVLVGLSGMMMITLSVTYILQIISAVANKRAFASQVTSVGRTGEEFILRFWDGENFEKIELQLNAYSQQLATLAQQHMAFPILHYYHTTKIQNSQGTAIAILYDAVLLLKNGVEAGKRPTVAYIYGTHVTIKSFLESIKSALIEKAQEVPPEPSLLSLNHKGVPTVPEQEFLLELEKESDKRRLALGLLKKNAREWPT